MSRSALACLPAAILAAFVGVIATPAESRASSPSVCSRSETISLQRPDERQFEAHPGKPENRQMFGDRGPAPARGPSPSSLETIALETSCTSPASPADLEPSQSREDVDAVERATYFLEVALSIAGLIFLLRIAHAMGDFLHSETPASQGAAR